MAMPLQEDGEMDVDREPCKPVLTKQQWTEFDELQRRTNADAVLAAAAADVAAPLLMAHSHRVSLRVSLQSLRTDNSDRCPYPTRPELPAMLVECGSMCRLTAISDCWPDPWLDAHYNLLQPQASQR